MTEPGTGLCNPRCDPIVTTGLGGCITGEGRCSGPIFGLGGTLCGLTFEMEGICPCEALAHFWAKEVGCGEGLRTSLGDSFELLSESLRVREMTFLTGGWLTAVQTFKAGIGIAVVDENE